MELIGQINRDEGTTLLLSTDAQKIVAADCGGGSDELRPNGAWVRGGAASDLRDSVSFCRPGFKTARCRSWSRLR
jgi:hypothetical protein